MDWPLLNWIKMKNIKYSNSVRPTFCLVAVWLMMPFLSLAQPDRYGREFDKAELRERMDRMFVAYLTEELDLSVEQGQRFWPLYNELKGSLDQAESAMRDQRKTLSEMSSPTQASFEAALDNLAEAETELIGLKSEFMRRVSLEFDPDFAIGMMKAKKSFEKDVRERIGQRMSERGRRGVGKMGPGPGRQRR